MLLSFVLNLFYVTFFAVASSHHHDHSKHSHLHGSHKRVVAINSTGNGTTLDEARKLMANAQAAMARANQAIVSNPRKNRLEVLNATELIKAQTPPPPLDYRSNVTAHVLQVRGFSNGTEKDSRYSVPDELIEAARLLSESWNPSEYLNGDYAADVYGLQQQYKYEINDTNMMPPMLQYGSGLTSRVEEPPSAFRYGDNTSSIVEPSTEEDQTGQHLQRRGASDWWMAKIQQRGSSPFAPTGYKIWRNVKDFGAKGDGIADDTKAINLAISSGGRCGGGSCTGSTIYPATVYFPPGTYKVSSSIIQYYNTELLGNPLELPTILAAPSFVGLGVITSNIYTGETSQWYLNQNNFLRSVRNFIIDIRPTPQGAMVCGIHWQVAQGTSLENIHFYSTKPKDNPSTTQQGIYMENGSGGFLSDLYFVGGKFGAYMGNQQFTASGLYFQDSGTAIQIHWDWGWTLQNIVVDNCQTGLTIVGGAGGPMSNGQGIGSLLMTDMRMKNVRVGISTSMMSDNSTALLLSNSEFYDVSTIVEDTPKRQVLLPGGAKTSVGSWGFGRVTNADGNTAFHNGAKLDSPVRPSSLITGGNNQFFTRRRPKYDNLGFSQIIDARAYGAHGDGKTDDAPILNYILSAAANMSAIVYLPFGVYVIKDTIEIPVGSRIIGQAWPQLMATGPKFANAMQPHVAIRVGQPGQAGVVELQSMMFTVKGATAGAVMMEWNVHEAGQGSAGLWDTHFRAGGAAGTELTAKDCPKLSGKVNEKCMAASLMLHLKPESSGYFENVWMWTADHDFDTADQTQIDIYVGRGMLIESKGPTWLWGTSVEHCILYQYQLSGAENVVMGLIQTESPYFQSLPTAPAPFVPGAFPNDPAFHDCSPNSKTCGVSWAVRLIDSSSIHILSAGLYSFFSRYNQDCIKADRHDCQDKIFYAEQSFNVWIYNLVTLGSVEMISPLNGVPTLGKPNKNGFASSILAWFSGAKQVTGKRSFTGYRIHTEGTVGLGSFPQACQNALTGLVRCDNVTRLWTRAEYHGIMPAEVSVDSVCDAGCAQSISDWLKAVNTYCTGFKWDDGATPGIMGSFVSFGINETCQTDKKSGRYCNDIIVKFKDVTKADELPDNELCSDCYVNRLKMLQASPYSIYAKEPYYQRALKAAVSRCSLGNQPTDTKDSPFPMIFTDSPLCLSDVKHTTQPEDTCNNLALKYGVSSAAIFTGNPQILDCNDIVQGVSICLPLQCKTYNLQSEDDCLSVEIATGVKKTMIRQLNPWVEFDCGNLQSSTKTLGSVLCVSAPGGHYDANVTKENSDPAYPEFASKVVPPPSGAILAEGTTEKCGRWQRVNQSDDCAQVLVQNHISLEVFTHANPSVSSTNCTSDLIPGRTYCVGPTQDFLSFRREMPEHWSFGYYNYRQNEPTNGTVLQLAEVSHVENMSLLACKAYCLSMSYHVFGLMGGDSCLCDTRLRMDYLVRYLTPGDILPCTGNSSETCGGDGVVHVFSIERMLPIEAVSLGCFVQDEPRDILSGLTYDEKDMSVQKCGNYCRESYTIFFALSEGTVCTCGSTMNEAQGASMAECSTECGDGFGYTCGGKRRAEVYATFAGHGLSQKNAIYHNFDDGTMGGWTVYDGTFEAGSKALVAGSSYGGKAILNTNFANFTLETDIVFPGDEDGNAGLVFRTSEAGSGADNYNGYYAGIDTSGYVVLGRANKSWNELSRTELDVRAGRQYHIMVRANGDSLDIFVDDMGSPKISVIDSTYYSGMNGVRVYATGATFDNVKIYTFNQGQAASQDHAKRTASPIPAYEHFGCYSTESSGVAGLSHSSTTAELGLNVEYCAKYCLDTQGQTLFGLENGSLCRCGSQLQMGTEPRPESSCAVPCPGNSTQICGGYSLLSVFGGQTAWEVTQESATVEDLTVERCAKYCTRRFEGSEILFSVNGGNRCNCVLSAPDALIRAPTAKSDCDIPCAGDFKSTCGGETASNVYRAWS